MKPEQQKRVNKATSPGHMLEMIKNLKVHRNSQTRVLKHRSRSSVVNGWPATY